MEGASIDELMDRQLSERAKSYAEAAAALSSDGIIRVGIMKAALRDVVWALFDAFPDDRHELADWMDDWPDLIREKADESKRNGQANG